MMLMIFELGKRPLANYPAAAPGQTRTAEGFIRLQPDGSWFKWWKNEQRRNEVLSTRAGFFWKTKTFSLPNLSF